MGDVVITCSGGYVIAVSEQGPPGPPGSGGGSFAGLADTPSSFESAAGNLVVVNDTETGVQYTDSIDGNALTIQLKAYTEAGVVPPASDLVVGELAINVSDGTLYVKKSDGTVSQIAGSVVEQPTEADTDGGTAFTIYLPGELIDGGVATSTYAGDTDIDGGTA